MTYLDISLTYIVKLTFKLGHEVHDVLANAIDGDAEDIDIQGKPHGKHRVRTCLG